MEQRDKHRNGRFVAFISVANNLVSGDTNGNVDVFVHDRQTGTTERVSVDSSSSEGNRGGIQPDISGDGRFVAFTSDSNNLVSGDSNNRPDIFVHDRQTGTTSCVSVDSSGTEGNGNSVSPSISGDGRLVAFESDASNLVSGDTNFETDIFVAEQAVSDPNAASCDPASGFNVIHGTPSNDKIKGTPGNDIIFGYGGNDRIEGLGGNDCLIGGEGNDQLYGGEGNDILWGSEVDNATIYDSKDRDKLYGDDGDDMMYGEAGDDKLYGRQGDDTLDGGDDNDRLDGSAGTDSCIAGEKLKGCEA